METFDRARPCLLHQDHHPVRLDEKIAAFLITHLLPKPKSIAATARREVEHTAAVDRLPRELFTDHDTALDYLESRAAGETTCLLSVGPRCCAADCSRRGRPMSA
ncbi:hypothetical protein [Streptomyces sp. NPDC054887]